MADQLTVKQWRDLKPPFHWMKVKKATWPSFIFEMAEKHLYTHTTGYWFHGVETADAHLFIFEHQEDMIAFKLWLSGDPFKEEYGEIG